MTTPLVSILMAVHNEETYLARAIDSILAQTLKDFELVIVDDGSTDSTRIIIKKYMRKDSRIRILSQNNTGLAQALNNGLRLCSGRYIARHDGDDLSMPSRLEMQVSFMELNPSIGLLGTNYHVIDGDDNITTQTNVFTRTQDIKTAEISSNQFGHGTMMVRRDILGNNPYSSQFEVAQDYDLWSRLLHTHDAANIPTPLYAWRSIGTGQSTKPENAHRLQTAETKIRLREFRYFLNNRRNYSIYSWRMFSTAKGPLAYAKMKNTYFRNMALLYAQHGMRKHSIPLLLFAALINPTNSRTYIQLYYTLTSRERLLFTFQKEYI